jgi:hypothetical protein
MRRVIVESPYRGDVERNTAYARRCIRDCILRGEAPIASHLLYTQPGVLNDDDPLERAMGINAGHAWIKVAKAVVVYIDYGTSDGMRAGMRAAEQAGIPIEIRQIFETSQPREMTEAT